MSVFTLTPAECYANESEKVPLPPKSSVRDKLKEQHATWNAGGAAYTSEIQQRRAMQLSEDGRTMACSVIAWAVRGNTIDVLLWTMAFSFGMDGAEGSKLLGSITSCVEDDAQSLNHIDFHKCFSLAKNGKSLIAVKFTNPKTIVRFMSRMSPPLTSLLGCIPTSVHWHQRARAMHIRRCLCSVGLEWRVPRGLEGGRQ